MKGKLFLFVVAFLVLILSVPSVAGSFVRPECLEKVKIGRTDALVLCGTDEVFTYLIAPEITVDFGRKGFVVSPNVMYGPLVNVEGVEAMFSAHPRSSLLPKTFHLGSKGGFIRKRNNFIYFSVRSFLRDKQGHKFYSESSGVKYK